MAAFKNKRSLAAGVLALLSVLALALAVRPFGANAQLGEEPNVILLLTDDQSVEEMRALPQTSSLIGGAGVSFNRAYISYPLCCPARASLFSGQHMHNHGVRGNNLPFGGWSRFEERGTESRALPTWIQGAGYHTALIGKYMNGYGGSPPPVPPGWDEWYGKVAEYNPAVHGGAIYFNYTMREDPPAGGGLPCPNGEPNPDGEVRTCFYGDSPDEYQTDVLRDKSIEAIDRLSGAAADPFFLSINFNAPHSPYVPAPRHAGAFAGASLPAPAGRNEKDIRDKPRFLRRLPKLGRGKLIQIDNRRRQRLEMLLSVDEAIAAIVDKLADEDELDNTYLIFLSDNGYFSGEHRIRQGKYLPHEPSSRVPLMVRGPGIPAGASSDALVSNVDVASTIAEIAGAQPALRQDGESLLRFARSPALESDRPILLEADVGPGIDDDADSVGVPRDPADAKRLKAYRKKVKAKKRKLRRRCAKLKAKGRKRALICFRRGVKNIEQEPTDTTYKLRAPAYSGLRTDRYQLTLYATGELELYDMLRDPFQLNSVHKNRRYRKVRGWMLSKLTTYSRCEGTGCSASTGPEPLPAKKKKKTKKKPKRQARRR